MRRDEEAGASECLLDLAREVTCDEEGADLTGAGIEWESRD